MLATQNSPSAADIVFLRNTGIVLVMLTALAGSISVTGAINMLEIAPAIDLAESTGSIPLQLPPPLSGTTQTHANDQMQPDMSAGAGI